MSDEPARIPFNRPYATGREMDAIREALALGHLSSDGSFSRRCAQWLEESTGAARALMTPSATSALELAAMLIEVGPGDEVVMPSYTFPSTANAFVLRGATPVFIDIRADTLNLDESKLADAITTSTKAVVPVHYGGVSCEMEAILEIAGRAKIRVIEDAAQGILASRDGHALGTEGDLGVVSFHETKHVTCGEGGALLINDPSLAGRAEVLRDKGTNRQRFLRGEVDKYTWVDIGSSYGMSDLNAAFLWTQLEAAEGIDVMRMRVWERYHHAFQELEEEGLLRRPWIPQGCRHNAHLYYLLLPDARARDGLRQKLSEVGIHAVFHFVPLHSSEAGLLYGRTEGKLPITDDVSGRILRLPLWTEMSEGDVDAVIDAVRSWIKSSQRLTA